MRLRTAALFAFFFSSITLKQVSGSGVFQLQLKSFRNIQGILANGNCCNRVRKDGRCSTCTTFFRICLTHYMSSITPNQECSFATLETPILGNNLIDFTKDIPNNFTNPMRFPFNFSWPMSFSLIIEAWHDKTGNGPSHGSPRDLIMRMAVQRHLGVGTAWVQFTYSPSKQIELEYSYRFICNEHYYGRQCTFMCRPRNDEFGHYNCYNNGSLECLPGWKGHYCDQPMCLPGCHPDQGYCNDPSECKCRLGWRGKYCDECIPHPKCQKGTCNKSWECNCKEGWGGLYCNQDLNYCTHHNPCKNDGTCTNTGQGSYTCTCHDGFNGTNCEIKVDNCQNQPCLNSGICEDTGTEYRCRCLKGYGGKSCEIEAVSCAGDPCRNSGKCKNIHGSYQCVCPPGYSGHNCELEINECLSNPCKNGRCIDDMNGFRCVCAPGFNGLTCEENVNDCSKNPCLNGGTCTDKVNDFVCHCVPGFAGILCETQMNDCLIRPCANGGTCIDLINDFTCTCPSGFTGKDCTTNIDDCADNPCKNGSVCKDFAGGYQCICQTGFSGIKCDHHEGKISNNTEGVVGSRSGDDKEESFSVVHLGLSICLGAGLPLILIIIAVIVVMLLRRHRHHLRDNMQKENEQNQIISKGLGTDIFTTDPSASSSDKVTKVELECSNKYNPEQFFHDKSAKILLKQNFTRDPYHKPYNKKMLTPTPNIDVGECSIKVDIEKPTNLNITDALLKNEHSQRLMKNNVNSEYQHVLATEV